MFQSLENRAPSAAAVVPKQLCVVVCAVSVVVAVKNEETGFAKIVVELPRGEAFGVSYH